MFYIGDKLYNKWLSLKNIILYNIFKIKQGDFKVDTKKYKLVTLHDFTNMNMLEFENLYRKDQAWGNYHPGKLAEWYDHAAVKLSKDGLELYITNNAKTVTSYMVDGVLKDNLPPYVIKNGVGLVSSKQSYGYGLYEWNLILPKGAALWPAAWISSADSWPPEIDVLEAYSDVKGRYQERAETNIHCGDSKLGPNTHYMVGADSHGRIFDHSKNLNLKLEYTEKYIKIYYNDFLCRVVTKEKHMKWFKNKKMINIMNTALRGDESKKVTFEQMSVSPMKVLDYQYYSF